MFTKTKLLRVLLPFLLIASVLTTGTPSASAAVPVDGWYGCSSGSYVGSTSLSGSYRIVSGSVTQSNSCSSSVVIATGVTSIAAAFVFSTLTSVTIPNTVTSIGDSAFDFTFFLASVTFEAGSQLTSIGMFAFYFSILTSLTIPSTVTSIGAAAFSGYSPSSYTYCGTSLTQTTLNSAGLNGKTRISVCSLAGLSSAFSSASSYDGRFTVQVNNYDSAFTYAVTSSVGQVSISSTGLITVTGLRPDQSVTVTMTTSRSGYDTTTASITGRSQVAAMLPGTRPLVTISDSVITCTIGSYSATPTSSAFSLFVDGKHVSTIFSALGEYLPDWIIPWATSSTITRTATLSTATWSLQDAYKGKAITCATLAYSKNAIGFTASQVMVAR